jgi:hypothetical protein
MKSRRPFPLVMGVLAAAGPTCAAIAAYTGPLTWAHFVFLLLAAALIGAAGWLTELEPSSKKRLWRGSQQPSKT